MDDRVGAPHDLDGDLALFGDRQHIGLRHLRVDVAQLAEAAADEALAGAESRAGRRAGAGARLLAEDADLVALVEGDGGGEDPRAGRRGDDLRLQRGLVNVRDAAVGGAQVDADDAAGRGGRVLLDDEAGGDLVAHLLPPLHLKVDDGAHIHRLAVVAGQLWDGHAVGALLLLSTGAGHAVEAGRAAAAHVRHAGDSAAAGHTAVALAGDAGGGKEARGDSRGCARGLLLSADCRRGGEALLTGSSGSSLGGRCDAADGAEDQRSAAVSRPPTDGVDGAAEHL